MTSKNGLIRVWVGESRRPNRARQSQRERAKAKPGSVYETRAERDLREFVEDISDVPKAVVEDAGHLLSFETPKERDLREFLADVTGEPSEPDWETLRARAAETPHERDLREFCEHITGVHEYYWDPDKHPRGAFSQNRGWFSPTGGSSGSSGSDGMHMSAGGSHGASMPRQFKPKRTPSDEHSQVRFAKGLAHDQTVGFQQPDEKQGHRPPGEDQLAQAIPDFPPRKPMKPSQPLQPQPGQQPPAMQLPPQQQGRQPPPAQAQPRPAPPLQPGQEPAFGNTFGKFQKPPPPNVFRPGENTAAVPETPANLALRDRIERHRQQQIPPEVRDRLDEGPVRRIYTDTLPPRIEKDGRASAAQPGAVYDPETGIERVPRLTRTGPSNTPVDNKFVENNVRHEDGHALDDAENLSTRREFMQAYNDDRAAMTESIKHNNPHVRQFLPEYQKNASSAADAEKSARREAFAQGFASATAPKDAPEYRTYDMPRDYRNNFPRTAEYVKTKSLPGFQADYQARRRAQQGQPAQMPPGQPQPQAPVPQR